MSQETFYEEPVVLDTLVAFDEDRSTNELIVKRTQEIPAEFLTSLQHERIDSISTPAGEMHRVASIPVEVVDDLLRTYGFDVMNAPIRETLKMLNRYALDKFITTNKRI
jgi:hypothetical protein